MTVKTKQKFLGRHRTSASEEKDLILIHDCLPIK